MILDLNAFEKSQTEHRHISIFRHKSNHFEIICKEISIKNGIEEVGNYKKLNMAAINCVPRMVDYEIVRDRVLIYLTRINGYSFNHFIQSSHLKSMLMDKFEFILDNAIECVNSIHLAGLIHRDIKPDNMIVDDQGRVFLIDFGIAAKKNCISQMAGSSMFMSPEAIFKPSETDESSDYFSLGMAFKHVLGEDIAGISHKDLERIAQMCQVQKKNRKIL